MGAEVQAERARGRRKRRGRIGASHAAAVHLSAAECHIPATLVSSGPDEPVTAAEECTMRSRATFALCALLLLSSACRESTETEGSGAARAAAEAQPTSTAESDVRSACLPGPAILCPVDEGHSDASFNAFRQEILGVIFGRNHKALLKYVDPAIRTSFGDEGGVDEFRRTWKPDSPESALWDELAEILRLGGSFIGEGEDRTFWAPYVYSAWPEDYDPFEHVAATSGGVSVRDRPDAAARAVATADWAILQLRGEGPASESWRSVRTHGGQQGYVEAAAVRSPIDYRAGFRRVGGEWRLVVFVAGD
jgi:hypothetical protein